MGIVDIKSINGYLERFTNIYGKYIIENELTKFTINHAKYVTSPMLI